MAMAGKGVMWRSDPTVIPGSPGSITPMASARLTDSNAERRRGLSYYSSQGLLVQCRRGIGEDSDRGIALQIAERSQEQIRLPEHESVPCRVWEAIEEAVLLARGGVELRAGSGGDQLPG